MRWIRAWARVEAAILQRGRVSGVWLWSVCASSFENSLCSLQESDIHIDTRIAKGSIQEEELLRAKTWRLSLGDSAKAKFCFHPKIHQTNHERRTEI